MRNTYLFLLLFSLSTLSLHAQRVNFSGQYLKFGTGTEFSVLNDEAIGAEHYQGLSQIFSLTYLNNKPNFQWWVEFNAGGGFYNSYNFPSVGDRVINHGVAGYDIGFMYPMYEFSNELYFWGGAKVEGSYAYNQLIPYSNSADNYTFLNSVGLNGMLHYTFNLFQKWWNLEWVIDLPVFTYYMRPGYSVNFPEESVGEARMTSFSSFFELDSKIRLVYPMANENKLSLEYNWNYYNLGSVNKVQSGAHALFLNAHFRLDNKK